MDTFSKDTPFVGTVEQDSDGHISLDLGPMSAKVRKYINRYLKRHGPDVPCYVMADGSLNIVIGKLSFHLKQLAGVSEV
jgi:hypothetical protein